MIRLITKDDIDRVLPLVEAFYEESLKYFGFPMSREATILSIEQHIKNESALVMEEEGKIVGVIGGHFIQFLGSDFKAFQEVMWYILPEHRKNGLKLFKETERHCKSIGISAIIMCYMANLNSEKMKKFYKAQGYMPLEVQWIKKL